MPTPPKLINAGVAIGETFLDKYRVDAILGHGGMGVVALCTHLALDERVAIKMLRRDVLDDDEAVERFMREAQAASRLRSEYVARVTDVGRSPSNVPYMVMEYLEGHDLGELLDERGSLGLPWVIELTMQACEALGEAHSIGIVHRDIKPTNLFVTWRPDGSPLIKVLDFGISKAPTSIAMQLTQTQSLLGTPAYMSPEQMRSARMVDARTDIWSLGIVLYELLEGRRPFEAETFSEMCVKVALDPPGAMTRTPPALQHVVLRCLAKTPEQRYASMAELGADLVPFAHDPHHAQVLAARMARALRRSQAADRDGRDSGRSTVTPERPALPAASDPAIPVRRISDASPTASDTLELPRRRRPAALLIAVALTAAAAVGVVVSLSRGAMAVRPAAPAAPSAKVLAPAPIALDQAGSAAVDATAPAGEDPKVSAARAAPEHAQELRAPKPAAHRAEPAATARTQPAKPKVGQPPCDPFSQAHGANACPPGTPPRK